MKIRFATIAARIPGAWFSRHAMLPAELQPALGKVGCSHRCGTSSFVLGGDSMSEQNFANHAKTVPAFHFFVLPVLLLNVGWSVYRWKVSMWSLEGAVWVM